MIYKYPGLKKGIFDAILIKENNVIKTTEIFMCAISGIVNTHGCNCRDIISAMMQKQKNKRSASVSFDLFPAALLNAPQVKCPLCGASPSRRTKRNEENPAQKSLCDSLFLPSVALRHLPL